MQIKLNRKLKKEYNSLAKFELQSPSQWDALREEMETRTGATGAYYYEIPALESKSGDAIDSYDTLYYGNDLETAMETYNDTVENVKVSGDRKTGVTLWKIGAFDNETLKFFNWK